MDIPHHTHHQSTLTRLSTMIKDTTRRKSHSRNPSTTRTPTPSTHPPDPHTKEPTDTHLHPSARDHRRNSSINASLERMRSLFHHTPSRPRTSLASLPLELLQQIFTYLPFWDLLTCQRVSKKFHTSIPGTSPPLLETLYLSPSRNLEIYNLVPTTTEFEFDVKVVPVLDGVQIPGTGFFKGSVREVSMSRRCMGLIRTSQEIVFHPVVREFNGFIGGERMSGEGGSWRGMLVSMPPLREVTLRLGRSRRVFGVLRVGEGEVGVTLGMLFDALEEWGGGS